MPDTQRTKAALIALLADGAAAHSTNRQLIRDLLVSLVSTFGDTLTGDLVIQGITVGRGGNAINGNTAFGVSSLLNPGVGTGIANTAFGFQSLANVIDAPGNVAIGYGAMGGFLTGNGANTAVGYQSGSAHTTATQNVGVGYWALKSTTIGSNNTAVGYRAMMTPVDADYCTAVGYAVFDALCGDFNTGIGAFAGQANTGTSNTVGGYFTFKSNTSGVQNTAWGSVALRDNVSGSRNVAIGYFAGAYELGSDAFYVDNQDRGSTANDKAKALLYGVFNALPASQTLVVNAVTTISQSLAVTGGITGALTGNVAGNVTGNITGTLVTAASGANAPSGVFSSQGVSGNGTISLTDTGASGANLKFVGNGATTPNKYIRVANGNMDFVSSGYVAVIASLSDAGTFTAKRHKANGTALVAGDFALSGGWGTTATIGTITGNDQAWQATVTSSGTGQGANPTITLTFHDGTWTNAPITVSKMAGGTGTVTLLTEAPTATTNVLTFQGTPVAGSTYVISSHAIGR